MKLRSVRGPIYVPIAATTLVFLLAAIGLVSSFGSNADVGGSSASSALHRSRRQQQQQQQQLGLYHRPRVSRPLTATRLTSSLAVPETKHAGATNSPLFRSPLTPLPRQASSLPATATFDGEEITKKRSLLRKIIWNTNPRSGRNDGRWRGGESKATLASKFFFSYVSPLLDMVADKSANRTLTEDDAFALNERRSMNFAVESLTETYDQTRAKARRQLEEKRQASTSSERTVKNSESLILLKALINDQKSALLLTGVLRFCNTIVQAFPSLLVARLLRSIEAGPTSPIQESLKAAFLLVGVLCLKMITENQYFHNVVNMATHVRGSVEGMIFDKSLRLPEGGSGVLTKVDSRDKKSKKNDDGSSRREKPKKALGSGGVCYAVTFCSLSGGAC